MYIGFAAVAADGVAVCDVLALLNTNNCIF
jgi:hypothetical protein